MSEEAGQRYPITILRPGRRGQQDFLQSISPPKAEDSRRSKSFRAVPARQVRCGISSESVHGSLKRLPPQEAPLPDSARWESEEWSIVQDGAGIRPFWRDDS